MMHKIVYNFEVVFFPKDFFIDFLVLFTERIRFNETILKFLLFLEFQLVSVLHLKTMNKMFTGICFE